MRATTLFALSLTLGCMEGERATTKAAAVAASTPDKVYVANGQDGTLSIVSASATSVTGVIDLTTEAGGKAWMLMLTDVAVAPNMKSVWATGTAMAMDLPPDGVKNPSDMTPKPSVADAIQDQVLVVDPSMDMIVGRVPIGKHVHPARITFDPAATTAFVTASTDLHVFVIDMKTYAVTQHFDLVPGHDPHGVTWCGGNLWVATGQAQAVTVVNPTTAEATDVAVGGAAGQLACTPDQSAVFVTLYETREVVRIAVTTREATRIALPDTALGPVGVVVSPDGARAYVADQGNDGGQPPSNRVFVLEVASASVTGTIEVGKGAHGVTMTKSGRLFVTNVVDGTLTAIDGVSVIATVKVGTAPNGVAAWRAVP